IWERATDLGGCSLWSAPCGIEGWATARGAGAHGQPVMRVGDAVDCNGSADDPAWGIEGCARRRNGVDVAGAARDSRSALGLWSGRRQDGRLADGGSA